MQQQMQAQMSDLQQQIVQILRNNPEVCLHHSHVAHILYVHILNQEHAHMQAQRYLGRDVSIMAVSQQASSTMIVNGKQLKREDLELVVAGSNGQGIVEAKVAPFFGPISFF